MRVDALAPMRTRTLMLEDVTERRALEQDMLALRLRRIDAKIAAATPPPVTTAAGLQTGNERLKP